MGKFFQQGVNELGPKLGPILWQFAPTKVFEADDFEAFLKLLPKEDHGLPLRHALEVRNASFTVPEFVDLAAKYGAAIVFADHFTYPAIADVTSDFVYLRLQKGDDDLPSAYPDAELDAWVDRAIAFAAGDAPDDLPRANPDRTPAIKPSDVFVYFIHEGKIHAPQAAMTFMNKLRQRGYGD
jgi:uncharacterized protein YecE (DUF72 family)